MARFCLETDKKPAGDQPQAIATILKGLRDDVRDQTLLGITGSGKTFTIANVIAQYGKPTLVVAHNKTLAAQLTQEYRELFPSNAVHYFVSYYDYYQPEAYVPTTDTYIEKEAQINAEIERLRHATTQALLTRQDVIIVASVSCIYGLGSPEEYKRVHIHLQRGMHLAREAFVRHAIAIQFHRTGGELKPGTLRVIGDAVEVMPTSEEVIYRIVFSLDKIVGIVKIDALTREVVAETVDNYFLFPARHFMVSDAGRNRAVSAIEKELEEQLKYFDREGLVLEKERLHRRTREDLALIREIGYCSGIENYSRHFDNRESGEPPHTLLSYFPRRADGTPDFLTIIDESHVTVPQIAGMYAGDRSRKKTLIGHGFRLPSAIDNRPLTFDEFTARTGETIYMSATPAAYEKEQSGSHITEQVIRPTGLLDPILSVRPITGTTNTSGQVEDFIKEAKKDIHEKGRVLITTLTKRSAENLSEYLEGAGIRARYLHSDVKTIERIELLTEFRKGSFDVLVGVNLLREGLDMPEVTLVAIFDADKEGFLRSETTLIQTIGRAARNVKGRVILYADKITNSLQRAVDETNRRRELQIQYNKKHGITPVSIKKNIEDIVTEITKNRKQAAQSLLTIDIDRYRKAPKKVLTEKRKRMRKAVQNLDFKTAAVIRDEIALLETITPSRKGA